MLRPVTSPRPYRLRGRLLALVSALVGLVVLTGTGTVLTAIASQRAIGAAHDMELASRRAALLGAVAREQYIHEAHTIIVRDRSHVAHHDEWVHTLEEDLAALRAQTDPAGRVSVDTIREASEALADVFAHEILPAIDRDDLRAVRAAHERANALVDQMTREADTLAASFEARANEAEEEADALVRLALAVTVALGIIAAALAVIAGRSLWRAIARPLAALDAVAKDVARGQRNARVGALEAEELVAVGEAVNAMLDALAKAEQTLVATERLAAIGRLAAGVAHEINNPIAIIRGYADALRADTADPVLHDGLRIIDEEGAVCQRITEDLRTYAHLPRLELAPAPMDELLRDAAHRFELLARARSAESPVKLELRAEPASLRVDGLRVRQVLDNLLRNALDATETEAPIELVGTIVPSGYRVVVSDRGVGLGDGPPERLFEPFYTRRRGGTGLGLAVCQGLVTAHGGALHAEPRSGGGARFIVELPDGEPPAGEAR